MDPDYDDYDYEHCDCDYESDFADLLIGLVAAAVILAAGCVLALVVLS